MVYELVLRSLLYKGSASEFSRLGLSTGRDYGVGASKNKQCLLRANR